MPEQTRTHGVAHEIATNDIVDCVQFCPFTWASNLLAFATPSRITLATCRFPEEDASLASVEFTELKELHHGSRVTAFAWSPESSLVTLPKLIRFCAAGADKALRIFSTDLKGDNPVIECEGHTDYINAAVFKPDCGTQLATASDDHTACIWSVEGELVSRLPLSSPGTAVGWHHDDIGKVLVGEKRGVIRFFNVANHQPILSLDCGHAPLLSVDWSSSNALWVAAVAGTEWFLFDTSRSSLAVDTHASHRGGGRAIGWCRSHDHLLATLGGPGGQVRVLNAKTGQVVVSAEPQLAAGLSWHATLPLLAVAGDRRLMIWAAAR